MRIALVVAIGFALAACSAFTGSRITSHSSESPAPTEPHYFQPCSTVTTADPALHALAAMIVALDEKGWTVESVDVPRKQIAASAVLVHSPKDRAGMSFSVAARGVVVGTSHSPAEMDDDIERWVGLLTPVYSKHSCSSDQALEAQTTRYGIRF